MPSRREYLAGVLGIGAGAVGTVGTDAAWDWATRNPRAPRGDVNLGEIDEDNIDWEADIEAGEESVFYQVSVNGPDTDRELIDTGMPSGRSNSHSDEFEPESPGTYRFALDAQTDTYDRTLDSAEMTVWGPLEPTDEGNGDNGDGSEQEEPHWTEEYSGTDFSGDLVGMGQTEANATADLFEQAYSDNRGIFDVSLLDADDVDEDHLTREWDDYEDLFLKVNNVAFPVYDGTPDTDSLEGLGYSESFVEDTLEPLEDEDELTRVGEEYAEEVLGL